MTLELYSPCSVQACGEKGRSRMHRLCQCGKVAHSEHGAPNGRYWYCRFCKQRFFTGPDLEAPRPVAKRAKAKRRES